MSQEKATSTSKNTMLTYKGHPLVRKDGLLYYGYMNERFVVMLQILETKNVGDLKVATRVRVELQATDPALKAKDRVIKKSEKDGLYGAMDIASVWLDRALASK